MQSAIAFAHFIAGRYAEALIWAQAGMRGPSQALLGPCVAAASAALMEDLPQANKAMIRVRQVDPDLRISNLKKFLPIQRPEDFSRWADGLRKAGLPE